MIKERGNTQLTEISPKYNHFKNQKFSFLEKIGFFGLSNIEPILISALAQEVPLLIIGLPGSGKTQLCTTLFEILGLNYFHYNASLINIEELIGFPVKLPNGEITYKQLPCSCWDKEAVFIDEISRCKPEAQNKFFSLIYEKKIYGLLLPNLKHRWAAMNPPKFPEDEGTTPESFVTEGTFPLDVALADRFHYILNFPTYYELEEKDKNNLFLSSNFELSEVANEINFYLSNIKKNYPYIKENYYDKFATYVKIFAQELANQNLHISTRRIKIILENLLWTLTANSLICANKQLDDIIYETIFTTTKFSIPHYAYKKVDMEKLELIINRSIKFAKLFSDIKKNIFYEKDLAERFFLYIEENTNIEESFLNTLLEEAISKLQPIKKCCFVVAGFKFFSKLKLSASVADEIGILFKKYTQDVKIKEKDETTLITNESGKKLELKRINFGSLENFFEGKTDSLPEEEANFVQNIFLNLIIENKSPNLTEEKMTQLLLSCVKYFQYYLNHFANSYKKSNN